MWYRKTTGWYITDPYDYNCISIYNTHCYFPGVPGLFLNGVVAVVGVRGRKELRPLEIYIVNIALSDLASIIFMYPLVIPALFMHYWPWGHKGQSEVGVTGPLHALLALGSHRSVRGRRHWPPWCIIGPGVAQVSQRSASLAPLMHYWPWGRAIRGRRHWPPSCIIGPGVTQVNQRSASLAPSCIIGPGVTQVSQSSASLAPSCIIGPGVAQVSQRSALLAPFMHYWPWGHTCQSGVCVTGPLHALLALGSHRSVRGPHYWPHSCIIGPGVTQVSQSSASLAPFMHYWPWGHTGQSEVRITGPVHALLALGSHWSIRIRRHWPISCIIGPGVGQSEIGVTGPFVHYWPWGHTGQSKVGVAGPLHALLALESHRSVRGPHYRPSSCIIGSGLTQVSQRSTLLTLYMHHWSWGHTGQSEVRIN